MSYDDNDFEDYTGEDNSPAGLRKAIEKANARVKAAEKKAADAEERAAKAEGQAKKSTLTELLQKKGIKPGLVRFLEKDGVEATPEAVDAWVKENREDFNIQPAEPKGEQQEQEPAEEAPPANELPSDLVQAVQASQQIDASGVSPSEVGVLQRLQSINSDPSKTSLEELVAQLKDAGAPLV